MQPVFRLPLRMLVLANLTSSRERPTASSIRVDKSNFKQVLASCRLELSFTLPNYLASVPSQLEVKLPIVELRDFTPMALLEHIPELAKLCRFRSLLDDVRQGNVKREEFSRQIEAYRGLDALAEPIKLCFAAFDKTSPPSQPALQPSSQPETPSVTQPLSGEEEDAVARILHMVDAPAIETETSEHTSSAPVAGIHEIIAHIAGGEKHRPSARLSDTERALHYTDQLLHAQLNACLHHPIFQDAEATWRGLKFLVDRTNFQEDITLEILDVAKDTLAETFHTYIAQPAYTDPPLSVIVAPFRLDNTPEDLQLLQRLGTDAEALQAPLIFSVDPTFFGVESAAEVAHLPFLGALFDRAMYAKWNALRQKSCSRWLAATCNRFLLRPPYTAEDTKRAGIAFTESTEAGQGYLWGNPVWALASLMTRSFARVGWPTEITGLEAGLIADLPVYPYEASTRGGIYIPLESFLSSQLTLDLHNFGFLPLSCRPDSDAAIVLQAPTLYQFPRYSEAHANEASRMQSSLAYQLLAGRLAASIAQKKTALITNKQADEIIEEFEQLLWDLIANSGASAQVHVRFEQDRDRPQVMQLVLHLRTGAQVLHNAEVELRLDMSSH